MSNAFLSGARPVLFGKLPRHGDFVARNLDHAARDAWDAFASQGLERSREVLAARFEEAYDAAPPWRFVTGPGAFGPAWRAGATAPSMDSAGRRFLIMLGAEGLSAGDAGAAGPRLAEAMEELIYRAFVEMLDADAVIGAASAAMAGLTPAEGPGEGARERWWTLGGAAHAPQDLPDAGPDLVLRMLTPELARSVT